LGELSKIKEAKPNLAYLKSDAKRDLPKINSPQKQKKMISFSRNER